MPSSRARTNTPIAPPANSSSASSVTTTVRLVVIERPSVWRIEWLTIRGNDSPAWRLRFSRIRSNTTIVSWTEKPMIVSIAVTNRLSIWTLNSVPRIAKMPTTTMTSWSSEIRAVTPIFTSRKRYVIQSTIPIAPNRMSAGPGTRGPARRPRRRWTASAARRSCRAILERDPDLADLAQRRQRPRRRRRRQRATHQATLRRPATRTAMAPRMRGRRRRRSGDALAPGLGLAAAAGGRDDAATRTATAGRSVTASGGGAGRRGPWCGSR